MNEDFTKLVTEKVMEKIKRLTEKPHVRMKFNGNFIHEIKGETYNTSPLVSINEVNAKSLIDRHTKDGYVIVSPCRGYKDFNLDPSNPKSAQKLAAINKARIQECIGLIKNSNFSYTPVYGGFIENVGTNNSEEVFERSFIIYPFDKNGTLQPFENLKRFAFEIGRKFNQDDVLIVEPNGTPTYYDKYGKKDFELGNNLSFNDISQEYFTDLHKNTGKNGMSGRPTRFSYVESYINPSPECLSESHVRHLNGEIFLSYMGGTRAFTIRKNTTNGI